MGRKTERWKEVESDGKVVDGKEERASEGNLQEKRRFFYDASFYIRRKFMPQFCGGLSVWCRALVFLFFLFFSLT